jgi:GTP-binding protein
MSRAHVLLRVARGATVCGGTSVRALLHSASGGPLAAAAESAAPLAWPLFGSGALPALPAAAAAASRRLFFCGARYLGDEGDFVASPPPAWTEMPFFGRSNVGKSSLLNALLGAPAASSPAAAAFVPVSRTPGYTRHLDFYAAGAAVLPARGAGGAPPPPRVGGAAPRGAARRASAPAAAAAAASARLPGAGALVVVDTPGFGFSVGGGAAEDALAALLQRYLRSRLAGGAGARVSLPRAVVLLDARLGITPRDAAVLRLLDDARCPYALVLTKADAAAPAQLQACAAAVERAAARLAMPYPVLCAVSARTGAGVRALAAHLVFAAKLYDRAASS